AAAITLLLPYLPKARELAVSPRSMAIMAGLLAFAGVMAGALSLSFHGEAREKALKAGALVLLIGGIGLQFGWFAMPRLPKSDIPWLHDEPLAVEQSRATGKPL